VFICSRNELISQMWPEGAQSLNSITKRPVSAGVLFKTSIIQLVEKNLALKVRKCCYQHIECRHKTWLCVSRGIIGTYFFDLKNMQ